MAVQAGAEAPFRELPEGTVTFLFTDIEGSTRLLHRLGDKYAALLADHHRLLRGVWDSWGGREMGTEGDAFFVAFPRATQAVAAAAEAQRALAEYDWPEGVSVRVRMGAHTGEPWVAEEGYVGIDLHRAARIAHAGHGGQVLLSETTAALVLDDLPEEVALLDLGRHLLKDMHRPEHIRQLLIEGLPGDFPPLTSQAVLADESERPAREVGGSPYRGLAAFREADAPFYFGREPFIDSLQEAVQTKPFVAVIVGSSGSGKSSVLFAGLLPRLRGEPGWRVASLRPGAQPFYALAGALLPFLESELSETDRLAETQKLAEKLTCSEVRVVQIVERILEKDEAARQLLLIIDQFEELYTLTSDEVLRQKFINQLLAVIEAGRERHTSPCVLMLTMRADFMGQALAYRPWADALQEASLLMGPMNREELRAAIEIPAGKQGAAFEAGLVERILDDVGDRPGNLPLLEFTLTQLWETQSDGWLTHADYEALGGVEGALASYADRVYEGLTEGEQGEARRALVQLVRPGEGTEDTRRVATRDELGDDKWLLIQHLAGQRLVVTGRDAEGRETAEVVHEALIQRWGRFQGWMAADRAFRAWQERLRANLRQWRETEEDEGALLSGAPLSVAQEWLAGRGEELSPAETAFIQAGIALQTRRAEARLEQQRKEQQLRAEQRAARRLRRLAVALAVFIVVAVAAAMVALNSSAEADRQRTAAEESESRAVEAASVAVVAQAEAENERDRADQEADAARQAEEEARAAEEEAREEAERAQQAEEEARAAQAEEERQRRIALGQSLSTIGPTVLEQSGDNTVAILLALEAANINQEVGGALSWSVEQGLRQALGGSFGYTILGSHEWLVGQFHWAPSVRSAVFSPDGRTVVTVGTEGTVRIWDLTGRNEQPLVRQGVERPDGTANFPGATRFISISAAAFAPGGQSFATGGDDNNVRLWSMIDPDASPSLLQGHSGSVNAVAFAPDGGVLASGSDDGTVRLWNPVEVEAPPRVLEQQASSIRSLAFAPDGLTLASGSADGRIFLWDMAGTGSSYGLLEGHQGSVLGLAFTPDGQILASGSADGSVRLWDLEAPGEAAVLYQGEDLIWSVAVDGEGSKLAAGGADGLIRIWALDDPAAEPFVLEGHEEAVYTVAFSPDGQTLVSGSRDTTIRLWDLAGSLIQPVVVESGHGGVKGLSFAADGETLASAGADGRPIHLWNPAELTEPPAILQHEDWTTYAVKFSPDGRYLASVGSAVLLWDAADPTGPKNLFEFELINAWAQGGARIDPITGLDFSADGQRLAVAYNEVSIWELTPPDYPVQVLSQNLAPGRSHVVAFSPDGRYLAANRGLSLLLWDLTSGDVEPAILTHNNLYEPGNIWSLAFAPDGRTLVSGGLGLPVLLWDVTDPGAQPLERLMSAHVLSLAISPNGQRLAMGLADGTVRVWSLIDELTSPPIILRGHEGWVEALAYSPDGRTLASGGNDGTIRFWPTLERLREIGCQHVGRNLTPEEWAFYLGEGEPYRETCP